MIYGGHGGVVTKQAVVGGAFGGDAVEGRGTRWPRGGGVGTVSRESESTDHVWRGGGADEETGFDGTSLGTALAGGDGGIGGGAVGFWRDGHLTEEEIERTDAVIVALPPLHVLGGAGGRGAEEGGSGRADVGRRWLEIAEGRGGVGIGKIGGEDTEFVDGGSDGDGERL